MLMKIYPMISGFFVFLKNVLLPFVIAIIITYVLNPIVLLLNKRKMPRTIAVLLIYVVFITLGIVLMMNLIPIFMKQMNELTEHLPEMTLKAQQWFNGFNNNKWVPDSVREGLQNSVQKLENRMSLQISNAIMKIGDMIDVIFIAFIIPFLAFYMLKEFRFIEKTALFIVPRKQRQDMIKLFVEIDQALGSYIRGQFLVSIIVGGLAFIGYWIIDMPYPLLLASIVAVFNIIPYLGPIFGAIPAIIMGSTISWKMLLLVLIVNLSVQVLEGNVISPQVVGKKLHLHPLTIILALLVGGELAGIVGMILAVPVFAVIKVIIHHVYIYYSDQSSL